MKKILVVLLSVAAASSAFAGGGSNEAKLMPPTTGSKISGAHAKTLIRALKYAGVKPTTGKDKWTFKATAIKCHSASETDDGLGAYDCEIDKLKLEDGLAYQLHEAMQAVGLPNDAGMSQTHVMASNLICVDDQAAAGGIDAIYTCTFRR